MLTYVRSFIDTNKNSTMNFSGLNGKNLIEQRRYVAIEIYIRTLVEAKSVLENLPKKERQEVRSSHTADRTTKL